jgi:hypothetical protein
MNAAAAAAARRDGRQIVASLIQQTVHATITTGIRAGGSGCCHHFRAVALSASVLAYALMSMEPASSGRWAHPVSKAPTMAHAVVITVRTRSVSYS